MAAEKKRKETHTSAIPKADVSMNPAIEKKWRELTLSSMIVADATASHCTNLEIFAHFAKKRTDAGIPSLEVLRARAEAEKQQEKVEAKLREVTRKEEASLNKEKKKEFVNYDRFTLAELRKMLEQRGCSNPGLENAKQKWSLTDALRKANPHVMKIGLCFFPTDDSIHPVELATAAEERGIESVWLAEHSHIPVTESTPGPGGVDT